MASLYIDNAARSSSSSPKARAGAPRLAPRRRGRGRGRGAAARGRSSRCGSSRLHHRRTLVPRCPITSPRWPRRPFIRTKASTKRQNAVPTPSASNEGQVFKGGGSLAADGEQHTDRAARAEGRRERYRWPPDHQTRRSECYRPTLVDEVWSAVSSQQTLVAFMTCAGMEEMIVERVTRAVS